MDAWPSMHACTKHMATVPGLWFMWLSLVLLTQMQFNEVLCFPELCQNINATDAERIHFAQNLEFLEAEFFLRGALGVGLDHFAPQLAKGGPPPIDGRKANLDTVTRRIVEEFGYQEIGHLRAIVDTVGGITRPLIDLSVRNWANLFDTAVGYHLEPPFDPYANTINYILASYAIPYVGLVGYVGTIPYLNGCVTRRLVAGLLGVESGQDAVIRALLYERAGGVVHPYNLTVADVTNKISMLRNRLAMCGIKDEGIVVPPWLGAENRTESNVLSANPYSLSYARTPQEILRIVYATGNEHKPGGFFPLGAHGRIARIFLRDDDDDDDDDEVKPKVQFFPTCEVPGSK